jgi:dimethylargininase
MLLALTRDVTPSIACCELTHLPRTAIDFELARIQHQRHEACLAGLGCEIHRVPAAPELPDAVFVEDTCVVLDELAVIARPGSESRRPETPSVAEVLKVFRPLRFIQPPGTLDGGDVLRLGRQVFVGRSSRTNEDGIRQLTAFLSPHGYSVSDRSPPSPCLHLKTAVTQVAENTLLLNPSWVDPTVFSRAQIIEIDPTEPFAANALLVNDTVVYPSAYPHTRKRLEKHGLRVKVVDLSELAKAEGGVTCCSVVFKTD